MSKPSVSIVIPTYNDESTLVDCLESIRNLDYQGEYEVIIVDGHSDDATVEIAERYDCTVLFENEGTISFARELGVEHSEAEYIAFTDADCVVPEDWLSIHIRHLEQHEDAAAVGGPNLTPDDDTAFARSVGDVLKLLSGPGSRYGYEAEDAHEIYHNPTCNVVYRREVLEEVGGFNRDLITVDDEEMDYRIRERGYTIYYTPDAPVDHYRRPSWKSFAKMGYRYGIGRAQATKLHPDMGEWFHFVPSTLILVIAGLLAGGLIALPAALIGLGLLTVGGIGILLMGAYLSWDRSRWSQLTVYAALIAIWFWTWGIGLIDGIARY